MKPIYLFILCINNGGSTMLDKILSRCKKANGLGVEGQTLAPRNLMRHQITPQPVEWSTVQDAIADPNNYNWPEIKRLWHGRWDTNKPVLVQKSPRDLFRATIMEHIFPNAHFIIMSRNPYSICETGKRVYFPTHRLIGKSSLADIFRRKTSHWVECHKAQIRNIESTQRHIIIRYEDLVTNPAMIERQIIDFIPILNDVKCSGELFIKSKHPKRIRNMDIEKINKLTTSDILMINQYLQPHRKILQFFGYQLIDPNDPDKQYCQPLVR